MHKPHPGAQLRGAGEALLNAWHTDEDEADRAMIVDIPDLLQCGGFQAIGFIDDQELRHVRYMSKGHKGWPRLRRRCAHRLRGGRVQGGIHEVAEGKTQGSDLLLNPFWRVGD